DGLYHVNKDDARRVALGLIEQVAYAAGADSDEHLDELGARNAEERHARFASDRAAEQCFARTWRTDQQHTFGDARAERGEFLGVLEKFDHFLELLLGLFDASHVLEGDRRFVAHEHARAALPETQG